MHSGPGFFALCAAATLALTTPASAHPHVWVVMHTQLVYAPDGTLSGIKQDWTFDEAFTAFALQGMDKTKDGTYGDDVLKPLAEVNVTSLKEYDYFVKARTATSEIKFKDPVNYWLTYEDEALTLHFTLPVEKPVSAKGTMTFEVYDPTYFVAFDFQEKDPVSLQDAPTGCVQKTVAPEQPQTMQLGEAFFSNLTATSTYGEQFADKITVKCP